jgi:ketosteroid isomerase-like protein
MKTKLSRIIPSLIVLSLIPARAADDPGKIAPTADQQALIKVTHDWATARQQANLSAVDRITAPDWMFTNPEGVLISKAQADANLKTGVIKFTSFKLDDIAVHVHGDTAVVFALQTQQLTLGGNQISGQFRSTDTFVKRDGRWQCIASQVTRVSQGPQ